MSGRLRLGTNTSTKIRGVLMPALCHRNLGNEPCATSRASRRGGGLQLLVRWLAANRTLQLGRANWGREGKLPHVGPRWDFPDDLALGLW
jgi:hypothetical protein